MWTLSVDTLLELQCLNGVHSIEAVAGMPSPLFSGMTGWDKQAHPIMAQRPLLTSTSRAYARPSLANCFWVTRSSFVNLPPLVWLSELLASAEAPLTLCSFVGSSLGPRTLRVINCTPLHG